MPRGAILYRLGWMIADISVGNTRLSRCPQKMAGSEEDLIAVVLMNLIGSFGLPDSAPYIDSLGLGSGA